MVLLELSITPLGAGESVGEYVARAVDIIDKSGLRYELHSMGTIIEGELDDVLKVVEQCVEAVGRDCDRVTASAKLDWRKGSQSRLKQKVESVEKRLGRKVAK